MDVEMGQPGSARAGGATPGSGSLPTTPRSATSKPPLARGSGNGPQPTPGTALTAGPQKVAAAAGDRRTQITSQQKVHELESQVKVLGADAVAKMADMAGDATGRKQVQVERDYVLPKGLVHPFSRSYRFWWWLTIVAACISGWLEPYQVGFLEPGLKRNRGLATVQYLLTSVFCIDIILSFFVSWYHKGVLVTSRSTIIKNYLRWRLYWDLLTTLPWDQIVLAGVGLSGSDSLTARYIGLLSLLRLGRMYRLGRLFRHLVFNLATPLLLTTLVRNATLLFYLVHWFGCIFYFMARQGGFGAYTWVGQAPELFYNKGPFEAYLVSLGWALSVFYTLGDADIHAISTAEVVWVIVFVSINIFVWAYVMGSVTLLVFKADEKVCTYRTTMRNLEVYSRAHQLPMDLKDLVQSHLRLQLSCQEASDGGALMSALPFTIKQKVLRHMYLKQLTSCWLLEKVKPKFMDALLAVARVETLMPRVEILGQGDYVNELLVLVDGYVEVFASAQTVEDKDREDLLLRHSRSPEQIRAEMNAAKNAAGSNYQLLGPGDSFGEFAFFTEVAQLELVRSLTVCRIMAISRPNYTAVCAAFPNSARTLLNNLQQRAEGQVQAEFRGGAASRLLRGSLATTLPGLTFNWSSAEQVAVDNREDERVDRSGSGPGTGRLNSRQEQVMGNLQRVRALVKQHVASSNEARTGQFLSAAARGEVDRIKLMLQQGFAPDTADYDNRTALMLAAANGRKEVVEMLLAANAKPNIKDNLGGCALMEAVKAGQDDIIRLLMAKSATLNLTPPEQATILCGAVSAGDIPRLKRLIRCRADVAAGDYDDHTPLHVAAAAGNLTAVQMLVEEGNAPVGARSRAGRTPLDDARVAQAQPVVEYLELKVGPAAAAAARLKFEADRADVALRAAADGNIADLQLLLLRGCSPDVADYDQRTVLMLGAAKGHKTVVEMLLSSGANPNIKDNLGGCALMEAVKAGQDDIVKMLVAAGGQLCLNPGDLAGQLCSLVYEDNTRLLKRYIAAGADVNVGDYDQRTALHIAAAEGKLDMVTLLVEVGGANTLLTDRWGSTALKEAQRVGAAAVVTYLQQAAAKARA